jgi:uncharacterized protein YukJ
LTDRILGAGAYGRVFMVVDRVSRRQKACKVVDLRKLRPLPIEHPATAVDVNETAEMGKLKEWAEKQKGASRLKDKLKVYAREFEILNYLNHVRCSNLITSFV